MLFFSFYALGIVALMGSALTIGAQVACSLYQCCTSTDSLNQSETVETSVFSADPTSNADGEILFSFLNASFLMFLCP